LQCLCHCTDCRKISGGNYSNNHVIPESNFTLLSGSPKAIPKTADTLWRDGETFQGMKVVKAGVLDDQEDIEKHVPASELYGRQKVNWVRGVDGAEQKDRMGA
jgi:hypothetical protein